MEGHNSLLNSRLGWYSKDRGPVLGDEKNAFSKFQEIVEGGRRSIEIADKNRFRQLLVDLLRQGLISKELIVSVASQYSIAEDSLSSDQVLNSKRIIDAFIPVPQAEITQSAVEDETEEELEDIVDVTKIDSEFFPVGTETETTHAFSTGGERMYKGRVRRFVELLEENGIPRKTYPALIERVKPGETWRDCYLIFLLPQIRKMISICDRINNGSFVVHAFPDDPQNYYNLPRTVLALLPMVTEITWNEDEEKWETEIFNALTLPDSLQVLADCLPGVLAELAEAKQKKIITLALLETDDDLLRAVVSQSREWPAHDRKTRFNIPGFEEVRIFTLFVRLGEKLGISYANLRNYLRILLDNREEASQFLDDVREKMSLENTRSEKEIAEFLDKLDFKELEKTVTVLYQEFLAQYEIKGRSEIARHFEYRLARIRKEKGIKLKDYLPKDVKELVDFFIDGLSDLDLETLNNSEIFARFLEQSEIKHEQCNSSLFARKLAEARKTRGIVSKFESRSTPEILAVRKYLQGLTDEELGKANVVADRYSNFLTVSGLKESDLAANSFIHQVKFERNQRGIASEQAWNMDVIAKVRIYLNALSDAQLSSPKYETLYADFLAQTNTESKAYSIAAFGLMLGRVRKERAVEPVRKIRRDTISLANNFIDGVIVTGREQFAVHELYKEFLVATKLTSEQYSEGAFVARFARRIKRESASAT